jgi:hypothetical protein
MRASYFFVMLSLLLAWHELPAWKNREKNGHRTNNLYEYISVCKYGHLCEAASFSLPGLTAPHEDILTISVLSEDGEAEIICAGASQISSESIELLSWQ